MQSTEIFFSCQTEIFIEKKLVLNIFTQTIDCGYTLEPPRTCIFDCNGLFAHEHFSFCVRHPASLIHITKTCPCNKQRFLSYKKRKFSEGNFFFFFFFFFFLFMLKIKIMGTHNLYFGAKIRKIGIPLQTQVFLYKSRVKGGIHHTGMNKVNDQN